MSAPIKLTPAQDRVLRLTEQHKTMQRRTGVIHNSHWIPMVTSFRPQPVQRLFALRFLRVVSFGVTDTIEVTDAGRTYLAEHPRAKS